MKTILVPVEQHSSLPSVLETALLVGRSVEGYIEGFAAGPDFRNIIALEVVFAPPMLDETAQREMVERARQRFETFMHARSTSSSWAAPDQAAMVHAPRAWKRLYSRVAGRFWSPLPGPPPRSAD